MSFLRGQLNVSKTDSVVKAGDEGYRKELGVGEGKQG